MDTTTDGFGYMLSVGDLLWVPFTYTMGARYLVFKHYVLDPIGTALVLLVAVTGYWIFRSANGEKNDFRNGRNPKSAHHLLPFNSGLSTLQYRSQVHVHEERHEASHIGMVGKIPASQLLVSTYPTGAREAGRLISLQRRLADGHIMVSRNGVQHAFHLFLPGLVLLPASSQATPG